MELIGILIFIIILLFGLVKVALQNMHITIPILAILAVGYIFWKKNEAEEAERNRIEAERRRQQYEKERHEQEQKRLLDEVKKISKSASTTLNQLENTILKTNQALCQAEYEFNENAFAPFWDAIENALKMLGRYHEHVVELKEYSKRYRECVTKLDSKNSLPSVVEPKVFPDATFLSERMKSIVRKAQTNIDFAKIYEHRRTNQILISGFNTIDSAIREMTGQLQHSILSLARENQQGFNLLTSILTNDKKG